MNGMTIRRFEDIEAWKLARVLTRAVYAIVPTTSGRWDYRFRDQLTAAAVSIMNNIAEGFDSQSNAELRRFLRYARRSCSEVQNCLYVALDQEYVDRAAFETLYQQAERTRQTIDGWIRYLRKPNPPTTSRQPEPLGSNLPNGKTDNMH